MRANQSGVDEVVSRAMGVIPATHEPSGGSVVALVGALLVLRTDCIAQVRPKTPSMRRWWYHLTESSHLRPAPTAARAARSGGGIVVQGCCGLHRA